MTSTLQISRTQQNPQNIHPNVDASIPTAEYEKWARVENEAMHLKNKMISTAVVGRVMAKASGITPESAAQILRNLASEDPLHPGRNRLNLEMYNAHPLRSDEVHGYLKALLYSHQNQQQPPFCIQLFVFWPGQETVVHDHPNQCTSIVLQGELHETIYQTANGQLKGTQTEKIRSRGSVGYLDHVSKAAHSLRNDHFVNVKLNLDQWGDVKLYIQDAPPAITAHLYSGMDGVKRELKEVTARRDHREMTAVAAVARIFDPAQPQL